MPPVLETKRLRLRPPRFSDLEGIYALGKNLNVMRYITGKVQTKKEAKADLKRRMASAELPLGYWIAELREDDSFVGWMALKQLDQTPDIEIGYRFLEEHWGRGLATEGGHRILRYGFEILKLERIVAVARPENLASRRVMEKLGFSYEQEAVFYNTSCVCYALSKTDYEKCY